MYLNEIDLKPNTYTYYELITSYDIYLVIFHLKKQIKVINQELSPIILSPNHNDNGYRNRYRNFDSPIGDNLIADNELP